jgi:hypothetical protein|nr:MAG TPA: hypothetical protein [Inoviridae sp.]
MIDVPRPITPTTNPEKMAEALSSLVAAEDAVGFTPRLKD